MKLLITGDVQAHNFRQFSYTRKNGMNSRLWNCLHVFDILLKEAKQRNIDKVLINGDVFEDTTYIEVEVFDGVYRKLEMLHEAGIHTVLNIGNHDVSRVSGQSGQRILHSLRAFRKVAQVVERPTLVWNHLQVVPWMPSPDSIKEAIRNCDVSKTKSLVGHFGVQGAKTGPKGYLVRNPIKLEDLRPCEWGLVLLSDYHTRQRLAKNVFYLGSPLQHSFSEVHRPCVWCVSLDREGIYRTERIYTDFPQFRRVHATDLREFRKETLGFKGDYVSVEIGNERITEMEVSRVANSVGFRYRIQQSDAEESVHTKSLSRSQSDIRRTFRKYVRGAVKGESRGRRLLELGQKLYRGEM
jgi:DNA repair exonuclease SbcCD nuclease subunit